MRDVPFRFFVLWTAESEVLARLLSLWCSTAYNAKTLPARWRAGKSDTWGGDPWRLPGWHCIYGFNALNLGHGAL